MCFLFLTPFIRHAQNVNKQNNPLEELASSKQGKIRSVELSCNSNEQKKNNVCI